jgi:hypothetical protein
MPRALTAGQLSALTAKVLRPAIFFEGNFDSGDLLLWTGQGPVTVGGKTYQGAGNFLQVSSFEQSLAMEANGITVTLSGIPSDLVSLLIAEPVQGRPIKLSLGLFTEAGVLIDGLMPFFTGTADVPGLEDGAETCTATLTGEGNFVDLMRSYGRRYEDADQQAVYPGDLGFQYVTTIQDKDVKWGSS